MDLLEENPMKENKTKKLRNSLIVVIILIVVLVIAAAGIYVYSVKIKKDIFKVYVDNARIASIENEDVFYIRDDKVFISIKDIADKIGYRIYNGEYKQYTEDTTSCYATNSKELVTFSSGAKNIRKYPQLGDSESQQFDLNEAILSRGGKLYIDSEGLKRAFNVVFTYTKSTNTVQITTLPYLSSSYEKSIENCSLSESELPEDVIFNNEKALLYNLVVIKDPDTKKFGISSYKDGNLENIITERYISIEFIEGMNDFIVQTDDKKYGIIGQDGLTKVKPQYDKISEIDKDEGLYLVESNSKPGVVNQSGKIIVYQDYDQIGLDGTITDGNVTNRYLLYGSLIPVRKEKKWGLINKNGDTILPIEYDGIGCNEKITESNSIGVVLIPNMDEGIVIQKNQVVERETVKKYGIINSRGEGIMNIVADSIYATTLENKTTYYVNVQNQIVDIINFWLENKEKAEKDYVGKENTTENQIVNQAEETSNQMNENNVKNTISEQTINTNIELTNTAEGDSR